MLGKIVNEGVQKIIYSPAQKTSSSGLFSNRRLAILSLPEAALGYLSKVPDQLLGFQDANCVKKCKQILKMKQLSSFKYTLDSKNASALHLTWLFEGKQKQWQFKFENENIAQQWVKYITLSLEPPKPVQEKIDFSKIQTPKSRFTEHYLSKQKEASKINEKEQEKQFSYRYQKNERNAQQEPAIVPQQNNQNSQDGSTGRFYKFEQKNLVLQREDTMPIITTFKQKFTNQEVLNTLSNHKNHNQNDPGNWNLNWYQKIENQAEGDALNYYKLFVAFCQQTCIELVKQITQEKRNRKFIPEKVNNQEEIYSFKEITFKLSVPFSINSDLSFLVSNQLLLKEYQQELQNNRFILRATGNKGHIKVPLVCVIRYLGFMFFCQANVPQNYSLVQQEALYLFQKPLQKLEQKLNLRLPQSKLHLYTNKPQGPPQKQLRNSYIIVFNLKYLLPKLKIAQNVTYLLPFQYYLSSQEKVKQIEGDKIAKLVQEQSKKFLAAEQSLKCRIISVEDLQIRLRTFMLDKKLIYWLITKCKSKYFYSILATEIIAQTFMTLVWIQISQNIKYENLQSKFLIHFQDQVFRLMSELIVAQGQSWEIVTDWIFKRYQLTIRHQDIKIGYLFSSISKKLGIQFDYQLMINQKQSFFSSRFILSKSAVLSYSPRALKYGNEDVSYPYYLMQSILFEQTPSENSFKEVVTFFELQSRKPNLQAYDWQALCRFMSFFVPIDQEKGYEHLNIYQSLSLSYLNFQVFQKMVSAIKWLLLHEEKEEVLGIISYFSQISLFWIGTKHPFSIVLQRLMGQYQSQQRNIEKAIEYFTRSVQSTDMLFLGDGREIQNLEINYKLAKLLLINAKHTQALQKFKHVKKVIQKQNKQSLIILDLMVEIAKLYLHLGGIQKCVYYAKQALKFATLFPFKSQEQEFQVYELILKSLQILGDKPKMKFYIDLAQDKFVQTSNHYILRQVLKLTIIQIVLTTTPYYLKKFAFFLHFVEGKMQEVQVNMTGKEKFKALKNEIGRTKITQFLKQSVEDSPEIIDALVLQQNQNQSTNGLKRESYLLQGKKLKILCDFIGFEYILGQIVSRLKQNNFF